MLFKGLIADFEYTKTIFSGKFDDTEGFVGYLPSDNSIWVTFRGTVSVQNWLTDLKFLKSNYKSFPECDCEVHAGFYDAE